MKITSRVPSEKYRENYDRLFRKSKSERGSRSELRRRAAQRDEPAPRFEWEKP